MRAESSIFTEVAFHCFTEAFRIKNHWLQEALVVGDTLADMGMGRSANLGGTVGVLSGICGNDELRPHADHVVRLAFLFVLSSPKSLYSNIVTFIYSYSSRLCFSHTFSQDERRGIGEERQLGLCSQFFICKRLLNFLGSLCVGLKLFFARGIFLVGLLESHLL